MTTTTDNTSRTTHLLELMKKGDDAFNVRDFAAMDAIHHPDLIAHVTGNAQPIYGRSAHAEAMKGMFKMFPDVHVENDPYPIQFGSGDWITVISHCTGTLTGELVMPDGNVVPPTGKSSTSSSSRPSSGTAIYWSKLPPSGTPLSRPSSSASPSRLSGKEGCPEGVRSLRLLTTDHENPSFPIRVVTGLGLTHTAHPRMPAK